MKKGLLIVLVLALIICTGCASKAANVEPEPLKFIDGIELGMTKAEVQVAEGREPDYVGDNGRYIIYEECTLKLEGYEGFNGERGYHFNESDKLGVFLFSLTQHDNGGDYDSGVVQVLLERIYGKPTLIEGDKEFQRLFWTYDDFEVLNTSFDGRADRIWIGEPGFFYEK